MAAMPKTPLLMRTSDPESEAISLRTDSSPSMTLRTASFVVNSPLDSEAEESSPSLASSGLLPAYSFADEIEEDYFCHRPGVDHTPSLSGSPVIIGLGIASLPVFGSGSTIEYPASQDKNQKFRSFRRRAMKVGVKEGSSQNVQPEMVEYPSPPGWPFEWESSSSVSTHEVEPQGSPESVWEFPERDEAAMSLVDDAELYVDIAITVTAPENTPSINHEAHSDLFTMLSTAKF